MISNSSFIIAVSLVSVILFAQAMSLYFISYNDSYVNTNTKTSNFKNKLIASLAYLSTHLAKTPFNYGIWVHFFYLLQICEQLISVYKIQTRPWNAPNSWYPERLHFSLSHWNRKFQVLLHAQLH
jgi:hypothetical protein